MIYRPTYMQKIIPFIDTPFVKVLTGVRRCGKTTVMEMIREELIHRGIEESRILSFRFDSLEHDEIDTASKLYAKIKEHLDQNCRTYLLLDEIQEVENWEKAVNSILADFNVDIYVTGSNSRMMSSEISTYLTGRYVSFRIFPLSFGEYLDFRITYTETKDRKTEFNRFLTMGGFPALQIQEYSLESAYTVVRDIYNSTIFTDIVKRNQIRKVDQLERIVKYVFSNVGNTFSALSISKYLKSQNRQMDPETIYSYLEKLESAYIVHKCSRYDIKGKEILKTQEKFYLADTALRFSVLGLDENALSNMIENVVFLELRRRGYDVFVGKLDNCEIDFVAMRQNQKLYIQIAQQITEKDTFEREYGNLSAIHDNYPKYVLRTDVDDISLRDGIITMNVADFLLSGDY